MGGRGSDKLVLAAGLCIAGIARAAGDSGGSWSQ